MTAHIYLGSHKIEDIEILHIHLNKIPRKGDLITVTIQDELVSGRISDVEWLLDKNEVNIFLD